MRDAYRDRSSIGEQIIDAIRDGDTGRVGTEIVIVDQTGRYIPTRSGIFERAHQFTLLRADATIESHRSNRIIPGWQSRMTFEGKTADLLWVG